MGCRALADSPNPGRISARAFTAMVIWGTSFVFSRIALESLTPAGLIAVRLALAGAALALLQALRAEPVLPAPGMRRGPALLGAPLGLHLLIQAWGLRYTTAINSGWIIGFVPVLVALGSSLWLRREHLPRGAWFGIALGAAGVALVISRQPPKFDHAHFGDVLQIVSCFTWAGYTLMATGVAARSGAMQTTLLSMSVAAILCAVPAAAGGVLSGPLTWSAALATGFLGLVASAAAFFLWSGALVKYGAARISGMQYLQPFVTLAFSVWLLGEPVTGNAVAGGVCVLAGVWMLSASRRSRAQHEC